MPRALTPAAAVVRASFDLSERDWRTARDKREWLRRGAEFLRKLRERGFDVVPRKTTRVKRKGKR